MAAGRDLHVLADEQPRVGDPAIEQQCEIAQPRAKEEPEGERQRHVHREDRHGTPVMAVIEPGERFPQRIDPVREREEVVERTEESRHHLDRVQAGRTGDLHDHEQHGQSLADEPEGDRERIDDAEIREPDEHSGPDKREGTGRLHADEQGADGDDQRLDDAHHGQQHPASEIGLARGDALDPLGIDLEFEEDHQDEATDPECEVHEQGRHRGTVVGDGEDGVFPHLDRGREELADLFGVQARHRL